MKLNIKLGGATPPKPAKADIGFENNDKQKQPTSVKITKLSEHADFRVDAPEQIVIPCQTRLPDPKIEDAKHRKHTITFYDPSQEGKDAWEKRQRELKDVDLGPNQFGLIKDRDVSDQQNKTYNHDNHQSRDTETNIDRDIKTGPILAQARHTVVGEAPQYDRVAVENFGMAMLMGMGFKPGEDQEVEAHVPTRRAFAKAGLGADHDFELPHERKAREDRLEKQRQAEQEAVAEPTRVVAAATTAPVAATTAPVEGGTERAEVGQTAAGDVEDIVSGALGFSSGLSSLRDLV